MAPYISCSKIEFQPLQLGRKKMFVVSSCDWFKRHVMQLWAVIAWKTSIRHDGGVITFLEGALFHGYEPHIVDDMLHHIRVTRIFKIE